MDGDGKRGIGTGKGKVLVQMKEGGLVGYCTLVGAQSYSVTSYSHDDVMVGL